MTTAYTSLLGLALPVTGELSGTWGDTVNNSITSLLDTSVAGTTNVSTDGDVTLTTTTGAANTARQAILLFSGARTALRTVTAPAQSKVYTVINATTGGFSVKLVGAGPTTGLTIPNGASAVVAWNGSDFVEIGAGSIGNLIVNGTLTVTGATTLQSTLAVTGVATFSAGTVSLPAITTTGDTNTGIFFPAADTIAFSEGGVESMRIDASGNLGLGVTPSAWSGFGKTMEFNNAGCYVGNSGATSMQVGANNYFNGTNYIYSTTNVATRYAQSAGSHLWFNAPSGTAGNAITFTQAMTLDASGNLGLGITAPTTAGSRVIHIANSSGDSRLHLTDNTTGSAATDGTEIVVNSGILYIDQKEAQPIVTLIGGTERTRIDSSGNMGIGTTSSGAKLDAAGTVRSTANTNPSSGSGAEMSWDGTNGSFLAYNRTGSAWLPAQVLGSTAKLIAQTSDVTVGTATGTNAIFTTNGTERARIDSSGNFGIGTATPASKLEVFQTSTTTPSLTLRYNSSSVYANHLMNGGGSYVISSPASNGVTSGGMALQAGAGLSFYTNGTATNVTPQAFIDTSGNLMVGTTTALQTASGRGNITINGTSNSILNLAANGSVAAYIFGTSTGATYEVNGTNAIGAAGANAITLTTNGNERARINSSGKLLLGCTTDNGGLMQLQAAGSNTAGSGQQITFRLADNGAYAGLRLSTGGALCFDVYGSSWNEGGRFDSNGNLLVGITSGSYKFMVGDGTRDMCINPNSSLDAIFLGTIQSKPLVFGTGNTERARIDSSGNLLINVTSTVNSSKMFMGFSGGRGFGINDAGGGSGTQVVWFQSAGTQVGSITTDSSTTSYNTSSDQRLKDNIQDSASASTLIDALKVRQFNWKSDGSHQRYGFVAQELVTVAPEAVHQPEDAEEMMAVDYSKLVPMLVKEIQSLRKRLADAGI
jgi:hypothetical protein